VSQHQLSAFEASKTLAEMYRSLRASSIIVTAHRTVLMPKQTRKKDPRSMWILANDLSRQESAIMKLIGARLKMIACLRSI
jgi:hypothetical protein